MKVLVTGATGFLGHHLVCKLLQEGFEVTALARKTSDIHQLVASGVDIIQGDLTDRDSLRSAVSDVEIVYHAGAATRGSWSDHAASTIQGTQNILEISVQSGVRKFVLISSLAVYDVHGLDEEAIVSEDHPYEPFPRRVGPYTWAKLQAEKNALAFCKDQGLPVVVVRPGIIFGPGGRVLFPHLGLKLRGNSFLVIGSGENLLPLTYVENTVDAILASSVPDRAIGQTYNIVDDGELTQRGYLEELMRMTGIGFRVLTLPKTVFYLPLAVTEWMSKNGLLKSSSIPTRYSFTAKFSSVKYDNRKVKAELDWSPRIDLIEGLKRTFEWYQSAI
jgi:2-alkyl-3-oxoalkanoate reductase